VAFERNCRSAPVPFITWRSNERGHDKVWHYCESTGVRGRTVTLKVKFSDFRIISRSRSRLAPISDRSTLASISAELLAAQFPMRKGVRLIGVSLSSLWADTADVDTQMALAL
jgi:DNA polymerase IV